MAQELPAPLTAADFPPVDMKQAELGQLLFYDKILSGNRNISCGTCHHPDFGTSDGLSLGLGEGGEGLGPDRRPADHIKRRVPRNAPALWNLGARSIDKVMHDGRISEDDMYGTRFNTPAEEWLPQGLDSVLAAQALFPMTSETEMAGDVEENEIAGAVNDRIDNGWPILAKRVRIIPEYGARFVAAFDHIDRPEDVSIVEIANALAAFMAHEFQSIDSAFDRYLRGEIAELPPQAMRGMQLFMGEVGCSTCHAGTLLSDQQFHALGLPAFGPGRTRKFDLMARDVGRMGESDALEDAYRFRTPMLRNVAHTGPYGHNGSYRTLEDMIGHHRDPVLGAATWSRDMPLLPEVAHLKKVDFLILSNARETARRSRFVDISLPPLSDRDVADIIAFLNTLSDPTALSGRMGIPASVPSGLKVDQGRR